VLCQKIKESLLEIIRHVEKDECPGCVPLKPIIAMAKLSPVFIEMVKEQIRVKPPN